MLHLGVTSYTPLLGDHHVKKHFLHQTDTRTNPYSLQENKIRTILILATGANSRSNQSHKYVYIPWQ